MSSSFGFFIKKRASVEYCLFKIKPNRKISTTVSIIHTVPCALLEFLLLLGLHIIVQAFYASSSSSIYFHPAIPTREGPRPAIEILCQTPHEWGRCHACIDRKLQGELTSWGSSRGNCSWRIGEIRVESAILRDEGLPTQGERGHTHNVEWAFWHWRRRALYGWSIVFCIATIACLHNALEINMKHSIVKMMKTFHQFF